MRDGAAALRRQKSFQRRNVGRMPARRDPALVATKRPCTRWPDVVHGGRSEEPPLSMGDLPALGECDVRMRKQGQTATVRPRYEA
jgi:hypothetical protein